MPQLLVALVAEAVVVQESHVLDVALSTRTVPMAATAATAAPRAPAGATTMYYFLEEVIDRALDRHLSEGGERIGSIS
jgi:hypothetical protein